MSSTILFFLWRNQLEAEYLEGNYKNIALGTGKAKGRGRHRHQEKESSADLHPTTQILPRTRLPNNEEEQPKYPNHAARSSWDTTESLCEIWSVHCWTFTLLGSTIGKGKCADIITEFGQEKSESLAGLSDKEIEEKVTG